MTAAFLSACDSMGPAKAKRLLMYTEAKNEGVERFLLRHTAMDHARASAKLAGNAFPSYFVSDTMAMWDAVRSFEKIDAQLKRLVNRRVAWWNGCQF